MMRFIDNQLNRITMYRLALYVLIFLLGAGFFFGVSHQLPFDPWALLLSVGFLVAVSWITNRLFSRTFGVPANVESTYISALILALIITPVRSGNDLWFLGWAAVLATASKYLVAVRGRHLFNPAAFAVALTYLTLNQAASWWVGSGPMLAFVLPAGLLVVRKLGRFDLVLSFLLSAIGITALADLFTGADFLDTLQKGLLYSPLLFFAFIILTEPLTTPPTRRLRIAYGVLVGLLFVPQLHVGSLFITPELAILAGNLYSFIVSPKSRFVLRVKERNRIAPDTYEFVFAAPPRFHFRSGQYMEWTLGHEHPDERGNRRYFTLASAPTERSASSRRPSRPSSAAATCCSKGCPAWARPSSSRPCRASWSSNSAGSSSPPT